MLLTQSENIDLKQVVAKRKITGLWNLMSGYRWLYILATLALGISAVAKTSTYLLIQYFVDDVLSDISDFRPALNIGLAFVGLAIIQGIFSYLSGRWAAKTAEGILLRLRNYLYDHLQRLSFPYHDQSQTGELIQHATSDVDAVGRFFSDQAIMVGRIIMLFVVNFIAILQIDTRLAFISIIVVPIVIFISIFFFRRVSKAYDSYQDQDAVVQTILQENLSGVRVVKAFSRQPYEIDKFEKENWEKFQRGRKLLQIHSLYWPLSDTICGIQMLTGYYIGARMALAGEITIGSYLAFAGLIIWIIWPMRNLGRLIVQMSSGLVSFGRIAEVIKEDREDILSGKIIPENQLRGNLKFDHVSFSYDDGAEVLQDICFSVNAGDSIALLGPTGSGKSSLIHLLMRFYDYTSGSICLDGVELKELSISFLRSNIGIVQQEPFLFSQTIRENIAYGVRNQPSDAQIEHAASIAAVHDVIQAFPEQYSTLVGERGVTLSGGQKQRVAIARTLLKNPRILILDDCTSSVDMETEVEIRKALNDLMKNRTTFIVAHRIQSVMGANHILVLDQGRIVQSGTHEELVQQDGIYRQTFEIQTRIESELMKEMQSV
ncbi:MAG: ABC transporter ATP-binding protein [Anaerolineales bacterium]|nr:ABC transporter ATP-binding protein [Anaerolineales bacterium]